MTSNQTTVESKPRKRVLTPPTKPVPKDPEGFITPGGKDISVKFDGVYGMYQIVFAGGPVPKELSGKFTERTRAEEAIERYLNNYRKGR